MVAPCKGNAPKGSWLSPGFFKNSKLLLLLLLLIKIEWAIISRMNTFW
jgi:hypothetical protein